MERIDQTLELINHWDELLNESSAFFSMQRGHPVTNEDVLEAIYIQTDEKNNYDWIGDVYENRYSLDEVKVLLQDFDFKDLNRTIECVEDFIPKDLRINYKVRIKTKGNICVIHKNDKDPFPSNPHAHILDSNIKLHLGNGNCYRKREFIYKINKKKLVDIREKALNVIDYELPVLEI
jgi:hypothetical protein